jgi:hypothetical protein
LFCVGVLDSNKFQLIFLFFISLMPLEPQPTQAGCEMKEGQRHHEKIVLDQKEAATATGADVRGERAVPSLCVSSQMCWFGKDYCIFAGFEFY